MVEVGKPESNRELLQRFLKGIENGSAMAASVVDERRYIQHNPQTGDDGPGIAALFERLSKTNPKVRFVRVFEDGDFAFAHIEYDFTGVRIAFEVFRFDGGRAVEHWDNIQHVAEPNLSGHSMIDGETQITDLDLTEVNRALVLRFVQKALISREFAFAEECVAKDLIQHAPEGADGLVGLINLLNGDGEAQPPRKYLAVHRIFAEGNFVLAQCEGERDAVHSGIYDLYRIAEGRIVEHWSTVEAIPERAQWKNDNGKF